MAAEKSNAAPALPAADAPDTHRLAITRLIDAPRELVFQAWTDPRQLVQWFVLDGLDTTHPEIDIVAGGKWVMAVRLPDGTPVTARRVFREIVEPERIVFDELCEARGKIILDGTHTVTFEAFGGKTRLTVVCEVATAFNADDQQGWNGGWAEILDRLAAQLAARAA